MSRYTEDTAMEKKPAKLKDEDDKSAIKGKLKKLEYFHSSLHINHLTLSWPILDLTPDAQELLNSLELPSFVGRLLLIYGVRTLKDMTMFDEDDLAELVAGIQNHSYDNIIIDGKDEKNVTEFLGTDCKDVEKFDFTAIDKKKLKKMKNDAQKLLYEEVE